MTQRERDLRKRFQQTLTRHRRTATASTWFTLGTLLADAYAISQELGQELSAELGDPITCWRRCVRLAPDHVDAWRRLGQAYFELDDRANAERALKRCVKLKPRDATAWKNLAVLAMPGPGEEDATRVRRAERYLARAIAEDPRGKKLGWEPYAWLAEAAERRRDDPGALAWYNEAYRRGDRYAAARKQVIEDHGARRRARVRPGAKIERPRETTRKRA
jgi:tetratricopeptide (TPR) repeat protein